MHISPQTEFMEAKDKKRRWVKSFPKKELDHR